ncbi:hypothetical protein, no similarity [Maudiozyma saulgeensis]|uniref:Uncharacterized protein n=1 Tax=Maudiozyma saulgeensis TaxID=1789683 RepID=A0A1X7R3J5_9SACH|nr:hypothetical protein, no similarity [Kazachstania saulgeensis]
MDLLDMFKADTVELATTGELEEQERGMKNKLNSNNQQTDIISNNTTMGNYNADDFLLMSKTNEQDEVFLGGMIEELDFSKWLTDDDVSRTNEDAMTNIPLPSNNMNDTTGAPSSSVSVDKPVSLTTATTPKNGVSEKRALPDNLIGIHKDRFTLKRTKSNPFYSPSQQIRNLVMKKKGTLGSGSSNNNKFTLQKSYSTDVLPLSEKSVNVKRTNSTTNYDNTKK